MLWLTFHWLVLEFPVATHWLSKAMKTILKGEGSDFDSRKPSQPSRFGRQPCSEVSLDFQIGFPAPQRSIYITTYRLVQRQYFTIKPILFFAQPGKRINK